MRLVKQDLYLNDWKNVLKQFPGSCFKMHIKGRVIDYKQIGLKYLKELLSPTNIDVFLSTKKTFFECRKIQTWDVSISFCIKILAGKSLKKRKRTVSIQIVADFQERGKNYFGNLVQ